MPNFSFKHITLTAKIYLLAIGVFTVFRLILLFTNFSLIESSSITFSEIIHAFLIGLRFDIAITGYIALISFLILTVLVLIPVKTTIPLNILFYLIFISFSVIFTVCAVDIPFFNYFFIRFNTDAFQWFDSPEFVATMIIQDFGYIGYIIPLAILLTVFFFGLKKSFSSYKQIQQKGNFLNSILLSICFSAIIFFGIRGISNRPLDLRFAFFSSNAFLNQLGLNPNFTLFWSWGEFINCNKTHFFMDNEEAIEKVKSFFSIESSDDCSPILRRITPDTLNPEPPNVVLVIMESMTAARLSHFGSKKNLTPFLDSITDKGYLFENIYSSGMFTRCGIFSTLYSYPQIYKQFPMRYGSGIYYNGMASALKKNGYNTTFFTTHDGNVDHINYFMLNNGFDEVISQNSYPPEKIISSAGVPDDFMFEFAMPVLKQRNEEKQPFFAVFLTATNHPPFIIPDYFASSQNDNSEKAVEYADWALNKFMNMAAQQTWFDNTLFIFIADHGRRIDDNVLYSMPLNYYHVPLIMYAPKIIKQPKILNCIGGQIDIFPTAMHLLNLPYSNNTLGINLFTEQRPFIYFSVDNKYGVISDSLYLIVTKNSDTDELYRYRNGDTKNYIKEYQSIANEMKDYAKANFQTAQYIIHQHKTLCE